MTRTINFKAVFHLLNIAQILTLRVFQTIQKQHRVKVKEVLAEDEVIIKTTQYQKDQFLKQINLTERLILRHPTLITGSNKILRKDSILLTKQKLALQISQEAGQPKMIIKSILQCLLTIKIHLVKTRVVESMEQTDMELTFTQICRSQSKKKF